MAREARELIERIRSEYSIGLNGKVASILVNALEVLSYELYDTETHFLLELLQNADDNTYNTHTDPTLTITYQPGSLRVDCNETGFTASNVEAICTIRGSTKGSRDSVDGFTGEKGIGFKSVFKAADVVWISSNSYSFKFDKRERLGMICPSWATFPEATRPKTTSMFFQLGSDFNEELLETQLQEFNPLQLLFLRRIRRIHLIGEQKAGPVFNRNIQRFDYPWYGQMATELTVDLEQATYVVVRHQIQQMPNEPRRQNCTQSELALAFPTADASTVRECSTHNVYATLPIRDYGLKFLLHGDFVLTANRLEIEASLAWNKALLDNVADAFIAAVDRLNETPMKDIWPYFVPGPETSPFFEQARWMIMAELKQHKVLLTFTNKMAEPSELFYVDLTKFADKEGIPFTLTSQTEDHYLSPVYRPWIVDKLSSAGLRRLLGADFLEDLRSMIDFDPETFRNRPLQWHSELARALMHLLQMDPSSKSKIQKLPLIPTRSGKWVSARSAPVFLDGMFLALPKGVGMPEVVDAIAAKDRGRRLLFLMLRVRNMSMSDLCNYITNAHASSEFHPDNHPRAELISHADFLFRFSRKPVHETDIWFATSTDLRCPGSSLYMRGAFEPNSSESRVFEQLSRHFPVIHNDYLAYFITRRERDYLTDVLQICSIPRLVEYESVDNFHLSNDVKVLFQVCQASNILQVLCKYWQCYSRWITQDVRESESKSRSRLSLLREIGEMAVQTRIGLFMLRETMLSRIDPNIESEISLPTLDLEIHDGFARQGLKQFGIMVETDINYYLSCLSHIRHEHSPRKEVVSYLYEKIQDRCDGHEELVRDFFKRNTFVYVDLTERTATEQVSWITIDECAKRGVNLEARYPTCGHLFGIALGSNRTKMSRILADTEMINTSTGIANILRIFTGISRAVEAMAPLKAIRAVKPLMGERIMPVRKPGSTSPYDLVAPQDTDWFIADQMYLQVIFCDKVPLLAFSVDELLGIKQLLQSLNLEQLKLSQCVQELSSAKEPFTHCNSYEKFLRDRVTFIQELIPNSNSERETLIRHLKSISVSTAGTVIQEYILEHGDTKVHGRPHEGNVCSSFNDVGMKLYLANEDYPSHQTIFDIGDEIAQYCGIKETQHLRLLYETLGESDALGLQTRFAKKGLHVTVPVQDTVPKRHQARTGDLHPLLYPFSHDGEYFGDELNDSNIRAARYGRRNSPWEGENEQSGSDRRLPILKMADVHFEAHGIYYMSGKLDPTGDLRFIGQHMASHFLEAYLGTTYDPARHWTSELRVRAGLSRPEICDSQAAFTMAGSRASTEVIDFLLRCGFDGVEHWRGILQTVHFEVVTSESATGSPFVCNWSQIQRFRQYKLNGCLSQCPRDVVILLRVRNVYQRPQIEISIDPWELFCSEEWLIQGDGSFSVSMEGHPIDPVLSNGQITTPSSETFAPTPQTAMEEGPQLTCITRVQKDPPKNLETGNAEQPIPSTGSSQNVSAVMGMQEWANHDYVYKNLDDGSFRVFILFPGLQGNVLRGEISTIPLMSDRRYRTLSYVWGIENQPTHTILTPDGVLTVKESLNDALLTLRQKSSPVHLWIDAICIDQNDAKEKAHQIRLLPRIYQNASCTVAFLGADKTSNDAIMTLMQINAKSVCGSDMEQWPKDLPHPPLSWGGRSMPGAESQVWTDIMAFFRRPWFRRAWIIQEAIAAPTVTMLEDLRRGCSFMEPIYGSWMAPGTRSSTEPLSVSGALEGYRHVNSTLARDRFFALLGLASDGDNPEYEPDYNSSFEYIVVKIARVFVTQGRGMALLNAAGLGFRSDRFPSWIPDWTITTAGSLADSYSLGVAFNASGSSQAEIHCGDEPDVLAVKGHLLDAITKLNESPNDTQNQRRYFGDLESIADVGLLVGIVEGWKSVTTKKGLRGMVPGTAKIGDSVCILNGGDVPFLLRKGETYTNSYRLVGQCYITGIMHGEALASRKTFPQVFRLY